MEFIIGQIETAALGRHRGAIRGGGPADLDHLDY